METSTQKLIVLKELEGNPPVTLDPVQQFFAPHADALVAFWVAVWVTTAVVVLVKVIREYLQYRKNKRY